jgi:hypothetical protein
MKFIAQTITIALIGALLLGTVACGRHSGKTPATGAVLHSPQAITVSDTLAELDALGKPEGVDAELWGELKGALKSALSTNYELPTTKITSSPPSGPANRVQDLTATRETNGDFTLSWHYRNIGDYDQNGAVGVSDLSPLAMHFGETYDAETETNSIQAVIDGSGNGKIGVEDITQIAQYFASKLAQYSVQGGDQQQGPFTQTTTVQLPSEGRSDARLAFALNLGGQPAYTYWRVVPMDGEGGTGDASNVAVLNVEAPVRVLGVTPLSGLAGAEVTFTVFITGTGPFTYEWDFGTGATPTTSTDAQPTVTLSTTEGPHPAHVKVTGATGSVTYPFTLTVTTLPGNPPIINTIGPFAGLSGEQLDFTADVDGDEPLSYSWEFDGGASPPVSSEVSPTAVLSRGGTLPAPAKDYPCRLTVTNEFGTSSVEFTITVTAQWHVEDLPPLPGSNDYNWVDPVLDKQGFLRGVYYYDPTPDSEGGEELRLLKYEGGSWTYEKIKDEGCRELSLAFDNNNEPGISYSILTPQFSGPLYYIHKSGAVWSDSELIFEGGIFSTSSQLFYDSQNRAVVDYSYRENETSYLVKVARKITEGWQAKDGYAGYAAINISNSLYIASNITNQSSVYLYKENETGWSSKLVIGSQEITDAKSYCLVLDDFGLAHMVVKSFPDRIMYLASEEASGDFILNPITEPVPKPSWHAWAPQLLLTDEGTKYVLFTSDGNDTGSDLLGFKASGGWEYEAIPIQIQPVYGRRYLFVNLSGDIEVVSTIQIATFW